MAQEALTNSFGGVLETVAGKGDFVEIFQSLELVCAQSELAIRTWAIQMQEAGSISTEAVRDAHKNRAHG